MTILQHLVFEVKNIKILQKLECSKLERSKRIILFTGKQEKNCIFYKSADALLWDTN